MIIVAGHACLDVIPAFHGASSLSPGSLVRVGAATIATGGVSNVGVALHRLGMPVRLVHKVGDDLFGGTFQSNLNHLSPGLASGVTTAAGETTSYSIVISPPGVDRMFIHCAGANDTFTADDVSDATLTGGRHLHFGYPPIMREVYRDSSHCDSIFKRAKRAGLTTSLDLCSMDPNSEAARIDWSRWFKDVLPSVDLFTPSFDELSAMLGHDVELTPKAVRNLAERCLQFGCAAVLMKLGQHGLFYADVKQQLHQACRKVEVNSTNGSGDCTIAGFLAARYRGDDISQSLELATAVGAVCCETSDATSGTLPLEMIDARLKRGWDKLPTPLIF